MLLKGLDHLNRKENGRKLKAVVIQLDLDIRHACYRILDVMHKREKRKESGWMRNKRSRDVCVDILYNLSSRYSSWPQALWHVEIVLFEDVAITWEAHVKNFENLNKYCCLIVQSEWSWNIVYASHIFVSSKPVEIVLCFWKNINTKEMSELKVWIDTVVKAECSWDKTFQIFHWAQGTLALRLYRSFRKGSTVTQEAHIQKIRKFEKL